MYTNLSFMCAQKNFIGINSISIVRNRCFHNQHYIFVIVSYYWTNITIILGVKKCYFSHTKLSVSEKFFFITFGLFCICKMSLLVICRFHTQMTEFCVNAQNSQILVDKVPLVFQPKQALKRFYIFFHIHIT